MTEFIFKRDDYMHPDSEKDRRGVHKKGDFIDVRPDGWSAGPNWAASSHPVKFVVVKCPAITLAQAQASNYQRACKDDFDFEVLATRAAQGEYDIRVFEKNPGAVNQNSISGEKAIRIRDYMLAWGCSGITLAANDASFTFSLWNAVRSANFWEVKAAALAGMTFTLNSYSSVTGIGNITVTVPSETKPAEVLSKIEQKGRIIVSQIHPNYVFTIELSLILAKFKAGLKDKMQQTFMRHQYAISSADVDTIIAAGGVLQINKTQFLAKLKDKMAAV